MKGKHSLWGKFFAVALLIALATISCQSQPAAAPSTAAPAVKTTQATASAAPAAQTTQAAAASTAAAEIIKLGVSVALTGPASQLGIQAGNFIQLSIDDVNAKGGVKVGGKVYKFAPDLVDNKNTSEAGIEAANKLVLADKVKFILGEFGTATAGSATVGTPNKVLQLVNGALDAQFGPKNPYMISFAPMPGTRIQAIYEWVVKTYPQAKRVAVIDGDDALGQSTFLNADKNAKALGLTIVSKEAYPMDTKDFSPLVTRVLRNNPDAIDLGAAGSRGAIFLGLLKALQEQGYKGPIFAASYTVTAIKGNEALAEGTTQPLLAATDSPPLLPVAKDVYDRYMKRWAGTVLEPSQVMSYDMPWVLAQTMEKAGSVDDTDKLAATMRAGEWDTIFGKQRIEGAQTYGLPVVLSMPTYLTGVRGGKLVIVGTVDVHVP